MRETEALPQRRPSTRQAYGSIFDEAARIVGSEFSRPLRIEEVAQRVATSPRQLQRVFPEVCGLGFRAYLTRVRMCRAAELLVTTDLPVQEIGRRVGYGDASQSSKAFKRTHGVSPSHARVRLAGNPTNGAVGKLTHCTQPRVSAPVPRVSDFRREEVSPAG
jgi:transcriptional regulator GlxA family with amidase domain